MPTPQTALQKDGTIRYRVRFRTGKGTNGSRTFFNIQDAEDFCGWIDQHGADAALATLQALNDELRGGPEQRDTSPLFDAVAREFFDWKRLYVRAERTVPEYENAYRANIKPRFGMRRIASITPAEIDQWVEDMVTGKIARGSRRKHKPGEKPVEPKKLSPKTIRGRHALLHSIMDYAAHPKRGYIIANPCHGAELPKQLTPPPKGLMPLQYQALHANLVAMGEQDAADLTVFLVSTGWRLGEALALAVSGVEDYGPGHPMWVTMSRVARRQSDGNYVIAEADGKAQKSMRRIQLDPDSAQIVRDRLGGKSHNDLVFTLDGEPWKDYTFRHRFTKAAKTAGVENATVHWLRHTHVAWLAMSGAPLPELQKRIGHADITTTIGVYGSLIGDVGADTLTAFTAMRDMGKKKPEIASNGTNITSDAPIIDVRAK